MYLSSHVSFNKLDLFPWSGTVQVYTVFAGFDPYAMSCSLRAHCSCLPNRKPHLQQSSRTWLYRRHAVVARKSTVLISFARCFKSHSVSCWEPLAASMSTLCVITPHSSFFNCLLTDETRSFDHEDK